MSTPEKKTKKSVLALNAYNKFIDRKDSLPKREFRALVVEEIKSTLGIDNPGTVGMYFSWAEKQITGRPAKVYSRGDGARVRKASRVDEKTNAELNALSNAFGKVGAARVDEGTNDDATFAARGFGAGSL